MSLYAVRVAHLDSPQKRLLNSLEVLCAMRINNTALRNQPAKVGRMLVGTVASAFGIGIKC